MELKFLQSSTNGRKPFLYGVIVGSVFGIGLCLGIVVIHGWKSQRTAEAESMMHDGYPYRGDTFSLWKDENGNTIPFHIETAEAKQAQIVQGDAVKATPIPGKTGQAGQVPLVLHTGSTSPIPLPNVPNPSRIFAAPTPVVQPPTIQPQQAPVILQPRAPMQEAPKAAEVKKTDSTKIAYFGDEETPR